MRNLNQRMEDHLYIEYRFGPRMTDDKILSEEHGYMPQIDEYITELDNWLKNKIVQLREPEDEIILTIDNPKEVWSNPFFDKCNIRFKLGLTYSSFYQSGGYSPSTINSVKIDITIKHSNVIFLIKKLNTAFAHELTHAYDDYCRRQKGGTDIGTDIKRTGYNKILDSMDNPQSHNEYVLANVFYKLNTSERNALIGMLRTGLMGMPVANSSSEGMKRLHCTDSWKRVESMQDAVDTINTLEEKEDKETIEDILKSANRFSKIHFNTFNQFKKVLNRRWENWIKKYMSQASKIIYDVMMEKKPRAMDEGVDWNNEPKIIKIHGTTGKKK